MRIQISNKLKLTNQSLQTKILQHIPESVFHTDLLVWAETSARRRNRESETERARGVHIPTRPLW